MSTNEGPSFTDDYLLYLLAHASAAASEPFHADLTAGGIAITTWRIFASLYPNAQMNVGALARKCLMKQPTLTRTLDRLVAKGIVARTHSKGDRRGVLVELTDKGRELARDKIEKARAHEAKILQDYSADEGADLKRLLRQLLLRAQQG